MANNNINTSSTIGIIIGRFQVSKLTTGHKEILDYVLNKSHTQNILILGNSPGKFTNKNPLDFESRKRMIEEEYGNKFTILYINDTQDDHEWSEKLDQLIFDVTNGRNLKDIILYGSRDS